MDKTLPRRFEYAAMEAMQIFFEGRVQGVGFRYQVKQIARGFDVTGWVQNLVDGRVELQVSGEHGELRAFLTAITESGLRAHIREQTEYPLSSAPVARGFEIRQ